MQFCRPLHRLYTQLPHQSQRVSTAWLWLMVHSCRRPLNIDNLIFANILYLYEICWKYWGFSIKASALTRFTRQIRWLEEKGPPADFRVAWPHLQQLPSVCMWQDVRRTKYTHKETFCTAPWLTTWLWQVRNWGLIEAIWLAYSFPSTYLQQTQNEAKIQIHSSLSRYAIFSRRKKQTDSLLIMSHQGLQPQEKCNST
jgi:hypothetical protein